MKSYWCLLIVLYINRNAGCTNNNSQDKDAELYHTQVGLLTDKIFIYGGVIISDKWVMSCKYRVMQADKIMFGTNQYRRDDNVNYVNINGSNVFINGRLALLKIDNENFTNYVNASHLKLPDQHKPSDNNKTGWLVGWHIYSNWVKHLDTFGVVMTYIKVGTFYMKINVYKEVGTGEKREPSNCYFCLLVPTPPKKYEPSSGESSKPDSEEDIGHPNYGFTDAVEEGKPYLPNQKDVNDLSLTKFNAVLLIFRLIHWKLLDKCVQVTEKASPNISQLLLSARWAVCLQQCRRSIRGYGITCNPSE